MTVIDQAKEVFRKEAGAILSLIDRINEDFITAVDTLKSCPGKVIVTGIGKSGIIAQKLASTLSCSGTPALFLHPAEGIHGDIGMVARGDAVIAVSNSGETDELLKILPVFKRLDIKLIVVTGNTGSLLSKSADVVLDIGVQEEACPLGLVPTTSTTAAMAMGDALALALLESRGFNEEDFAALHPGGALGRKLLLRVEDLMHVREAIPVVSEQDPMKVALIEMTSKRMGVTGVVTEQGELAGIITDGDLRRGLEREKNLLSLTAREVMTRNPKTVDRHALAAQALQMMEQYCITSLFIVSASGQKRPEGVIHLHDLLKAGIA